jgi:RNA polymerase sigma-70 factor (ECF subfamily)
MQNGATPTNEIQLIQAFKEGKDQALITILDLFHQPIVFFAQRLTDNQMESEEIASDIFMKLFKLHSNFETITNIKAFLYISTRNACLNWLKKNKKGKDRLVSLSVNEEAYEVAEPIVGEPFWGTRDLELIAKIRVLTDILPAKCRDIFIRHYFKHEKVNDIARDLGVERGTVYTQLEIGRAKIRASLLITLLLIIGVFIHLFTN